MQRRLSTFAVCLLAGTAAAQGALIPHTLADIPANETATTTKQEFLATRVAGVDLSRSVKRVVTELEWHKRLSTAQIEAQKTGKPILWLQLLGDLDGYA
ncbi:MAG: hypothetical protein KDB80_04420 [Planctomycetes bacterium]|nr:hypothetical protein [Planctomycetota bacterium]